MEEKEIIFFDELGVGWAVERCIIKKIRDISIKEEMMVEKTLVDLLRRHKSM